MIDVSRFLTLQRRIFGICPHCNDFFRLSDCKIYTKKKPLLDWKDKIERESERTDSLEEKINEMKKELQEKAREKGRRIANRVVKKIDPVFFPRKLNPDDAKVIFHPIDYVVFNGMKSKEPMKNIVLLDRVTGILSHKRLQKSIERSINHERYGWLTIRVKDDGKICTE
jgi:predicted Holliday junction resolvase-like endonuclease